MPPLSPSSSVQAARAALAERLHGIRSEAGLTGRELSRLCGWHPAKTTRIQTAKVAPSEADIDAWCRACGVEHLAADLIAKAHTVETMYVEWKRLQRAGLRQLQESYTDAYQRASLLRFYSSDVVPGVFQTHGYAAAILSRFVEFATSDEDLRAAVSQRGDRAQLMYQGARRIVCLVEESVLRYQVAEPPVMAAQLEHLLSVMSLPRVSFGVIPFTARRTVWPVETFHVLDDRLVEVELVTARVQVTAGGELREYLRTFAELQSMAVYGSQARRLVAQAVNITS